MDKINELCQHTANNKHIMTFSDIGVALAKGAVAGQKTGNPDGALLGAVLNLSLEAGKRAVLISKDMAKELKNKPQKP